MKFQTLSLVAGTQYCNARCPFCVSHMTGLKHINQRPETIHGRNLDKALRLAEIGDVTTVIITGKGEPMLFPEHIDNYLEACSRFNFPFIELQTNGSMLDSAFSKKSREEIVLRLKEWYKMGLTTILISNVGYDIELNHRNYFPKHKSWINIKEVISIVKEAGINIRLTTVGIKGGIDSPEKLQTLMEWASELQVDQITWRPVNKPAVSEENHGIAKWVNENYISYESVNDINHEVTSRGTLIYKLVHGAAVYDYMGKNLCLSNCLTIDPVEETVRQLIFSPNGSLFTDWQFKGSKLL